MIHTTLEFLKDEINNHLQLTSGMQGKEMITLSNVATQEGNWAIPDKQLGLSLINIEEERVFKEQRTAFVNNAGLAEHYNPEIKLNLYVLISANFTSNAKTEGDVDYLEGLKQLSSVISFFQGKNVFTEANSPGLEEGIDKLVVELFSYSFEQLYNFWSVIGAKYLPSVLYRVRLLTVQEKNIQDQNPLITGININ